MAPFTLPALGGKTHAWQPGRVTVLSFVAFWCDTWKEQNARLSAAGNAARGLPVEFLTLSVDGRWAERGAKIGGPVLLDAGGTLSDALGIRAVPYTLVVDTEGKVRHAAQGIVRAELLMRILRRVIEGRERPERVVYLTFDDFPGGEEGDEELLDLLRAEGVRATFFCLGRNVEASPDLARRAAAEGHVLQLHSWDHRREEPQLERCRAVLRAVAGVEATLYRPPGETELQRLDGAAVPQATVNPYDYQRPGVEELLRRVLHAAKPGSAVQLHAGVADTRAALPRLLQALKEQGYTFGVLE